MKKSPLGGRRARERALYRELIKTGEELTEREIEGFKIPPRARVDKSGRPHVLSDTQYIDAIVEANKKRILSRIKTNESAESALRKAKRNIKAIIESDPTGKTDIAGAIGKYGRTRAYKSPAEQFKDNLIAALKNFNQLNAVLQAAGDDILDRSRISWSKEEGGYIYEGTKAKVLIIVTTSPLEIRVTVVYEDDDELEEAPAEKKQRPRGLKKKRGKGRR